jgi:hypothetical protein
VSFRIIKDGTTFEADTADELRIIVGVLTDQNVPVPSTFGDVYPPGDKGTDILGLPITEPSEPIVLDSLGQIIPVRRKLLDVLDVIASFPEGITTQGVSTLIGVAASATSHRVTRLKKMGLVESVPHTIYWRATDLARKAKLVAS